MDCRCGCDNEEKRYYVGDDLKITLTINCEGFSQDSDPWTATFVNQVGNTYVCDKMNNTTVDINGQWYLLFRSRDLKSGMYTLVIDVDIPDSDFDGFRHEVYELDDFIKLRPKRV